MSQEFIDSIIAGQNLEAEDAFKSALTSKVGDALEAKRKEVAMSLIKNHVPETKE